MNQSGRRIGAEINSDALCYRAGEPTVEDQWIAEGHRRRPPTGLDPEFPGFDAEELDGQAGMMGGLFVGMRGGRHVPEHVRQGDVHPVHGMDPLVAYRNHPLATRWARGEGERGRDRGRERDRDRRRARRARSRSRGEGPPSSSSGSDLEPDDTEMAELVTWLELEEKMRIEPHQTPSARVIGQMRRQQKKGRFRVLDLGKLQTRREVMLKHSGEKPEGYVWNWEKGKLVATEKPTVGIQSWEDWSARWRVARTAYAMAMLLPWEVTEAHKLRVKSSVDLCVGQWRLVEAAERRIRLQWVMDVGTLDPRGHVRTFIMAAARSHTPLWQRELWWRPQSATGEQAERAAKQADEEDDEGKVDEERTRKPKPKKDPKNAAAATATKDTQVDSYKKDGKSHVICRDFQKQGGCKRKGCKYKDKGHCCAVRGCQKPGAPAHKHPH